MQMVDPSAALESFQKTFASGEIAPQKGQLHSDIVVLLDHPNGVSRFTYGLVKRREVVAVALFVPAGQMEGYPCFNSAYAVDSEHRSRGYGKEITQKAFDELTHGFVRAGVPHLFVEAIVSVENEHSNKLAARLFSSERRPCTDSVSGQAAFQYVRQLF